MTSFKNRIQPYQLIPVVSLPNVESAPMLAEILVRHGMEVAEVTFRTTHAAKGIEEMKKQFPEMFLLAGTVLTPDQASLAMDSGAEAIVSPGTEVTLVDHCQKNNMPIIPGVCTPSEIQLALSLDLTMLKFFPAELAGGVKMLKTLLSVYRDISFMPTGGVSPDNIDEYLAIERVLCCGGTWLAPEALMDKGDWQEIESRVKAAVESLQS